MKVFQLLLTMLLFCFHGVGFAQQPELEYGPFTIVQKEFIDINGDGEKEVIELYARKNQYDMANEWTIKIDGQEAGTFSNKQDLYQQANMEFADLLQNGNQEILLYFRSVGSGGITGLTVLGSFGKNIVELYSDANSANWVDTAKKRFSMEYTGDYRAEFVDHVTGVEATIPLSEKRYEDFPDKSELQKRLYSITSWVDPISGYRFEKLTKMKPQEIVTTQAVSGIAHYDVIAHYETRFVFDKQKHRYVPTKVSLLSTETGKKIAEESYK